MARYKYGERPATTVTWPSGRVKVMFILDKRNGFPTQEALDAAVAEAVGIARRVTGQEPTVTKGLV